MAAHIVTKISWHTYITLLLKDLHWLAVKYQSRYNILVPVYIKGTAQPICCMLRDMLQVKTPGEAEVSQDK